MSFRNVLWINDPIFSGQSQKPALWLNGLESVDLQMRGMENPYRMRFMPAPIPMEPVVFVNGVPMMGNVPLGNAAAQTGPAQQSQSNYPLLGSTNVVEPGRYGDSVIVQLTFTGAGFSTTTSYSPDGSIVLPRPQNKRAALLINNQTVPGPIFYNYDNPADNVASMQIAQGGSRNYAGEVVPQGNLSIFSSGAGTVLLEYINVSI